MVSTNTSRLGRAVGKAGKGKTEIIEMSFALSHAKGWKAPLAQFSRLGFDSISSSHDGIRLRKVQSRDILGNPHLFVEIEFRKNRADLRYSCPPESDARIRRVSACLMLMRAAYLLPGAMLEAKSLSELLLPSLEQASSAMPLSYESLSKSRADLQDELAEAVSQNRRLLRASEEGASTCASLERKCKSLSERLAQLEAIPPSAVDEMVLDWLSAHRGSLNLALFSKANNVPVARCEERLALLLKKGAIRRVSGAFSAESGASEGREFQLRRGALSDLKRKLLGNK